jgi:hypothetical protein
MIAGSSYTRQRLLTGKRSPSGFPPGASGTAYVRPTRSANGSVPGMFAFAFGHRRTRKAGNSSASCIVVLCAITVSGAVDEVWT